MGKASMVPKKGEEGTVCTRAGNEELVNVIIGVAHLIMWKLAEEADLHLSIAWWFRGLTMSCDSIE